MMKLYLAVFLTALVAPACFAQQNGGYYPQQQQPYNGGKYQQQQPPYQQQPYQQQNNGYNNKPSYPSNNYQYNNNNYNNKNSYNNNNYNKKCAPVNMGCIVGNTLICDYDDSVTYVVSPNNMTNYRCAEFCGANYFQFAITLNGSVCYCLFDEDLIYQSVGVGNCNAACSGNRAGSTDYCGSSSGTFFTLSATSYNCIQNMEAVLKEIVPTTCDSKILQCSSVASLVTADDYYNLVQNYPNMTNAYCASLCSVFIYNYGYPLGYFMSATYDGDSCACLTSPGLAVPRKLCSAPCSGASNSNGNAYETCGDANDNYATVSYTQSGCGLARLRDTFY